MPRKIDFDKNAVNALIQPFVANREPGMLIRIYSSGQILFDKAFGLADMEENRPLTRQTAFPVGSVSKEFTMVSILQFVEQDKLHLHDTIGRFVEGLPFGSQVTIKHLLSHTSGIKNYFEKANHIPGKLDRIFSPDELIRYFKNDPLEFPPGTRYQYSNSNYALLAKVIEQFSKGSYSEHLQKTFFQPLELEHSYSLLNTAPDKNTASGYDKRKDSITPTVKIHPSQTYGSGSVVSTLEDLYTWHQALYQGKLLSPKSFTMACEVARLTDGSLSPEHRGFSLMSGQMGTHRFFWNGGDISGVHTRYLYFPEKELYIQVMANVTIEDNHDHAGNLLFKIAGELLGEDAVFVIGKEYQLEKL
ncbi:serine hydrolase domain-containing protein [Rapidithrix thailandica]|uniref:Serine hydrolase domain-containing protein n=1 Tax=Rapidithrix thailandica TaxID=413964 RepID=A0AAW9SF49_9BACT